MSGKRGLILIVEDHAESARLMADLVAAEGFRAVVCPDAESARSAFAAERPVAVLVDWVLPDAPGSEVCRELRAADRSLTIMFVSGRGDEASVARGLDAGADDYVTKPIRGRELIARLESHLRRVAALAGPANSAGKSKAALRFGAVELDATARRVSVNGKPVVLGPLEFKLLEYLASNAGVAVSREQILNAVYGIDADIETDRVDLLVRRLRLKLGNQPGAGGQIVAHAGYGYMLEKAAR